MVIYGMDLFSLDSKEDQVRMHIPQYILNDNVFLKIKYFFNFDVIKSTLGRVLGKKSLDLNKMNYWGNQFEYSEKILLNSIIDLKIKKEPLNQELLNRMIKNIDKTLEIICKNKNIDFKIYFPPYSSLYWDYNSHEVTYLKAKEYFKMKSLSLEKLSVYDFQEDELIINNFDNYKDTVHFRPEISKEIIFKIKMN